MTRVVLSEMDRSFCPGKQHMEVSTVTDKAIYLQRVDGSGYDVSTLTPDEAIAIGNALCDAGRLALEKKAMRVARSHKVSNCA